MYLLALFLRNDRFITRLLRFFWNSFLLRIINFSLVLISLTFLLTDISVSLHKQTFGWYISLRIKIAVKILDNNLALMNIILVLVIFRHLSPFNKHQHESNSKINKILTLILTININYLRSHWGQSLKTICYIPLYLLFLHLRCK